MAILKINKSNSKNCALHKLNLVLRSEFLLIKVHESFHNLI